MRENLSQSAGNITWLQRLSQALMVPAMVLPLAGLLIMFGDLLSRTGFAGAAVIVAAGAEMIGQMPLFIAISLSYAMTAEQHGLAALSGAVASLVLNKTAASIMILLNAGREGDAPFNMGLLAGVIAGLTASCLHNYYYDRTLPAWLGSLHLRRVVPVLAAAAAFAEGIAAGAGWTFVQRGTALLAGRLPQADGSGAFAYGFLNRLLMPLGLHNVLNQEIWLKYGEFTDQSGNLVHGDLSRLLAGDPAAGMFIAGFYPMMIFALPAIALCLALTSKRGHRRRMVTLVAIGGLVSMVSGVTEPLEYLILFSSPILFLLLALMYGLSHLICFQLQLHAGFSFSTGLTDYLADWKLASQPQRIWQVGLVMAVLAFAVFYLVIRLIKLAAPGRERSRPAEIQVVVGRPDAGQPDAGPPDEQNAAADAGQSDQNAAADAGQSDQTGEASDKSKAGNP